MSRKGAGNFTVSYNANNITAYINQADLEMMVTELEATVLTSDGIDNDPGLPGFTLRLAADWQKALDDILGPDVLTPTKRTAVVTVTGDTGTVTYTWTNKAFITGYGISGGATGKITAPPQLRLGGKPTRV
jgi:hypothetical protein